MLLCNVMNKPSDISNSDFNKICSALKQRKHLPDDCIMYYNPFDDAIRIITSEYRYSVDRDGTMYIYDIGDDAYLKAPFSIEDEDIVLGGDKINA